MRLKHTLPFIALIGLIFASCNNKQYASSLDIETTSISTSDSYMNNKIMLLEDTIKGLKEEVDSLTTYKKETLSGKLTFGVEVATFKPCNSDKVYWINDKTKSGRLEKLYYALVNGKEPYTPVNAKVEIIDKGKEKYGFAADYDGTYEVINVLKIHQIVEENCK
ncbi:hypothetical protein A5M85_16260 [Cellulophaga lytica]|uniref:hypothetical protein n=1 Tax=Cellulophaga lytica TaxID=979 RepID=UPI0009507B35|nr:hypothetical protein [Cellulophaga lytica]APU11776.1 hypothetical protein A5M85_16260 [Cellulophaga lytica]